MRIFLFCSSARAAHRAFVVGSQLTPSSVHEGVQNSGRNAEAADQDFVVFCNTPPPQFHLIPYLYRINKEEGKKEIEIRETLPSK